jgi:hypothetical protein
MSTKKKQKGGLKTIESLLRRLPVSLTGCPVSNAPLVGIRDTTKTASISCSFAIPPTTNMLNILRADPLSWRIFVSRLGELPGYARMTEEQRVQWIEKNETDKPGKHIGEHKARAWEVARREENGEKEEDAKERELEIKLLGVGNKG